VAAAATEGAEANKEAAASSIAPSSWCIRSRALKIAPGEEQLRRQGDEEQQGRQADL